MTTRLNHFICPNCHHDFYDSDYVQVVCDACGKRFSITQSLTVKMLETTSHQQAIFHQQLTEQIDARDIH